jgi:hypothetical protein
LELKWRSCPAKRNSFIVSWSSLRGKINPNQWSRLMGEAAFKQQIEEKLAKDLLA